MFLLFIQAVKTPRAASTSLSWSQLNTSRTIFYQHLVYENAVRGKTVYEKRTMIIPNVAFSDPDFYEKLRIISELFGTENGPVIDTTQWEDAKKIGAQLLELKANWEQSKCPPPASKEPSSLDNFMTALEERRQKKENARKKADENPYWNRTSYRS